MPMPPQLVAAAKARLAANSKAANIKPPKKMIPTKWTQAADDADDAKNGIVEGSAQDNALDKSRGLPGDISKKPIRKKPVKVPSKSTQTPLAKAAQAAMKVSGATKSNPSGIF